eukprot:Em0001g1317a
MFKIPVDSISICLTCHNHELEKGRYGLNFDAFAKLSEKTLENWLRAHKIAHLEGGAAPAWKHPWTLPPSLVKEIEELVFQQVDSPTVAVTSVTLCPIIKAQGIVCGECNNIPLELVVNADQISIMLVPVGKRTYARLGAKAIRLLGIDDKRQVTVVAAAVADGTFLPYQVVLTGKTKKCLPPKEDRSIWAGALHGQITTGPILRHPSFSLTLSISPICWRRRRSSTSLRITQRAAAEPKGPRGRPTNAERQWRAAATNGLPGAIDEASDLAAAGPSTGTHPRQLASAPTRFNDESELESPIESDSDSNLSDAEVDDELNANGDGSED